MGTKQQVRNSVRKHRLARDGMTQQELGDLVGVSRQTIHSIEKGRYNPSVGLALELARVFGVAVEELFELGEEEDHGKQ
jgi:putative transcriptional regulator